MLQKCKRNPGWQIAATSCVWPDTAAANCRQLAPLVPEVGLYLMELASCLAYGPQDLPQEGYGLSYHLHLPLDLPWERGGRGAYEAMAGLLSQTAHLAPWAFVLHPPRLEDLEDFVAALTAAGFAPQSLLLENTDAVSPGEVIDLAEAVGCGVCLDLGHLLALGHPLPEAAARPGLVRMLHVYAPSGPAGVPPGRSHVHASLTWLDPAGRERLKWMLDRLSPQTVVIEVFSPQDLAQGLEYLAGMGYAGVSTAPCLTGASA